LPKTIRNQTEGQAQERLYKGNDMEIIGFKMRGQRGFEIYKNAIGDITIKQIDPFEDKEIIMVFTKYEAMNLQNMMDKLIDIAEDTIEQILENEDGEENDGQESSAI
jgi:hypothetical protein